MKKFLLAIAAIFTMTSTASALDFGNVVALDSEFVNEYNTETTTFTSVLTPRFGYAPAEGFVIWAETDLSIYDGSDLIQFNSTAFEGAVIGATYVPNFNSGKVGVEAYIKNNFDADFDYVDSVVGVLLNF